jgi:hypothetical protein
LFPSRGFTVVVLFLTATAAAAGAQEHEHSPDAHASHAPHHTELFPSFEASGTSWVPDSTPMAAHHMEAGSWSLMLHGNLFVQYLQEWAPIHRGSHQAGSINWFMAMARRQAAGGRFGARMMLSLEPWTIPGCGYPDLLASGELCEGDGLHDRQHPHDLFMEVAAEYEHPLGTSPSLRWHVYGGPSGEPALGPPAFPHRASAAGNPVAPISHHWLDATHISFGVATAGLSGRRWRAEASAFNGREPDESRGGFDVGPLDSFSGRLTLRPREPLALQVSAGRIESAEQDFAGGARYDITRVTASAIYTRGRVAATLAWGSNPARGQQTHAGLAEATLGVSGGHSVFGRAELNSKPSHALHIHEQPGAILTVGKLQGGYVHYTRMTSTLQMGLGGSVSAGLVPLSIHPNYGGVGLGIGVFAVVMPTR